MEKLRAKELIVDGELVALDGQGRHSFSLIQNIRMSKAPVEFHVFDQSERGKTEPAENSW